MNYGSVFNSCFLAQQPAWLSSVFLQFLKQSAGKMEMILNKKVNCKTFSVSPDTPKKCGATGGRRINDDKAHRRKLL